MSVLTQFSKLTGEVCAAPSPRALLCHGEGPCQLWPRLQSRADGEQKAKGSFATCYEHPARGWDELQRRG